MAFHRRAILLLLCCLAAFPAGAAGWLKLKSAHFELFTSQPLPVAVNAIERLERIRAAFLELGVAPSVSPDPLTVILFSGYNEFGFYSTGHMVEAYFTRMQSQPFERNVIVVSDFSKDVDPILFHEFAHYCSRESGTSLPLWLEEGLASYYESLELEDGELTLGKPVTRHVKLLKSKQFKPMPFGDLFSMRLEDRRGHTWDESAALYAEGWAVVHTLATDPRFAPKFGQFVARMRAGQSVQNVLSAVYGATIAQLRGDVDAHIEKLGRNETGIAMPLPAIAAAHEAFPLAPWEGRLLLTQLLVDLGKPVEAERDFDALRKEFPQVPQVWEALGDFKYARGEKVVAFRHYKTAVELGTDNPLPLLRLAEYEGTRSESIERAFSLLDASLRRHPRNRGMRMQAIEWAVEHKRYDKAADWAGRFAESGDVRDFEQNYLSGYVHYRADDPRESQLWLKRAIENTEDPAEKHRAQGVLDRVELALERRRVADRIADKAGLEAGFVEPGITAPASPNASPTAEDASPAQVDVARAPDGSNDTAIDTERLEMTLTVFTRDRGGKVAEGTLHELRCLGTGAQLVILSGGKPMAFEIDEPGNILITRGGQHVANYDFRCGRQKSEKVHIGYVPAEQAGRVGFLRILQFD